MKLIREWPVKRNQVALKLCVSRLKEQGMYDVVNAVPLNELSKEMFVYKVLDEMMSRQMYGLAEQVVMYVGTGEEEEAIENYNSDDSSYYGSEGDDDEGDEGDESDESDEGDESDESDDDLS